MIESGPKDPFATLMRMSAYDFDQSENGWRKYEKSGEFLTAANAIQRYLQQNGAALEKETEGITVTLLQFHLGQMLALSGSEHAEEAIHAFELAIDPEERAWNLYVTGTIAFLKRDVESLKNATRLVTERHAADPEANLGILGNFLIALQNDEYDYLAAYSRPRSQ